MASSSSSGLTFKLHPLVIVNISDHYTRVKSQTLPSVTSSNGGIDGASSPPTTLARVFGCVIGNQRGRTVEIFNSFELLYDPSTHSLDRSFLEKKQELCECFHGNTYPLPIYLIVHYSHYISIHASPFIWVYLALFLTNVLRCRVCYISFLLNFDVCTRIFFWPDKKVFPQFYVLGWYSTGTDAQESDMHIHRAVS